MKDADADRARRLPPGPHGLSPELVARNQRERLIAAIAEVCAEKGYGATSVADVVARAGVSTASFYRQFKDKRECLLASFDELFGRLIEAVEASCTGEAEPGAKVHAAIGTATSLLAADPPTAQLLTLEVVAVGLEGVRRQHEAIDRLALRLYEARSVAAPSDRAPIHEWAAVAAAVALVGRRVAAGESPDRSELEAALRV